MRSQIRKLQDNHIELSREVDTHGNHSTGRIARSNNSKSTFAAPKKGELPALLWQKEGQRIKKHAEYLSSEESSQNENDSISD